MILNGKSPGALKKNSAAAVLQAMKAGVKFYPLNLKMKATYPQLRKKNI